MGKAKTTLARVQEVRCLRAREAEQRRQDVASYYQQQKDLDTRSEFTNKEPERRMLREAREREAHDMLAIDLVKAQYAAQLSRLQTFEELAITEALETKQHEAERFSREIQALKEQSEELRLLKEKLNTAQTMYERDLQLQEKQMLAEKEQEYDSAFDKLLKEKREKEDAMLRQAQQKQRSQEEQIKSAQMNQIIEKQEMLKASQHEYAKERAIVDEIVRRIQEEDQQQIQIKRQRQAETQSFIQHFMQQQVVLRRERMQWEYEEEQRIQDYVKRKEQMEAEEAARRQAKKEADDRVYQALEHTQQLALAQQEQLERQRILAFEREQKQRSLQEAEAQRIRQEKLAQEMRVANHTMLQLKAERAERERQEEEAFRRALLEKLAEDDRLEQMNAQRRRLKQAEHMREVERLIAVKRCMFEQLQAEEVRAQKAADKETGRLAALVQEERLRMLREAGHLRSYLPKGVLRDMAELQAFDCT